MIQLTVRRLVTRRFSTLFANRKVLVLAPLLLLTAAAPARAELNASRISVGDTPEQVIQTVGSTPDRIETYRVMGASYEVMTFSSGLTAISVRFLFGRVVSVESASSSVFGFFK